MEGSLAEAEPSIFFASRTWISSPLPGTNHLLAIDAKILILFVENNTEVYDLSE